MTFDLFADPEPEGVEPPSTPPAQSTVPLSAARAKFEEGKPARDLAPCLIPYKGDGTGSGYRCRVGGGSAAFSDTMCQSWFCMTHRPWGFLVSERDGF